jgi:hypothetical protein
MADKVDDIQQISITVTNVAHGVITTFTVTPPGPVLAGSTVRLDFVFTNDGGVEDTFNWELKNVTDNIVIQTGTKITYPGEPATGFRDVVVSHTTTYRFSLLLNGMLQDSKEVTITAYEGQGKADITSVIYDNQILVLTPVDIQFDVTNAIAYQDTIWWGLYTDDGSGDYPILISGTYGSEMFLAQETKTKIITLAGFSSPMTFNARLKAGHVE